MLSNIEGFHISNQLSRLTHMIKNPVSRLQSCSFFSWLPHLSQKIGGIPLFAPKHG